MKKTKRAILMTMVIAACNEPNANDPVWLEANCPKPDMANVDLPPPKPPCAAAERLGGENVICVDFKNTTLEELKAKGWDFTTLCGNGWTIRSGQLELTNFAAFASTCTFTLPPVDLSSGNASKYSSVTLSVVQTLDVNEDNSAKQQTAKITLGSDTRLRWLSFQTGKSPRGQHSYQVSKADINTMTGGVVFQPSFVLVSGAISLNAGWKLESIAVQGNE